MQKVTNLLSWQRWRVWKGLRRFLNFWTSSSTCRLAGLLSHVSLEDHQPRVHGSWQFFNYLQKNWLSSLFVFSSFCTSIFMTSTCNYWWEREQQKHISHIITVTTVVFNRKLAARHLLMRKSLNQSMMDGLPNVFFCFFHLNSMNFLSQMFWMFIFRLAKSDTVSNFFNAKIVNVVLTVWVTGKN
jgi:hypothetical protein